MSQDLERDLRDALHATVAGVQAGPDLVVAVRERARQHRRNVRTALTAAVVAVLVAVPTSLIVTRSGTGPRGGAASVEAGPTGAAPASALPTGPPVGGFPTSGLPTVAPAPTAAAVRAAFAAAFSSSSTTDQALDAIEDGASLRELRAEFLAQHPGLARTTTITVNAVYQTSPINATAAFTLTYDDPTVPVTNLSHPVANGYRASDQTGTAVLVGTTWLVSRTTYCSILNLVGPAC